MSQPTLTVKAEGLFADFGSMAIDAFSYVGGMSLFIARTIGWMFRKPPRGEQLLPTFYDVGIRSLPVIAITGTFIGMVLAVQTYYQFRALGLESRLGAVINMTLVRELGPVLAATMLAGRVGSAMAAQLGTLRVTEQIDALPGILDQVCDAIECWLVDGIEKAMSRYNAVNEEEGPSNE